MGDNKNNIGTARGEFSHSSVTFFTFRLSIPRVFRTVVSYNYYSVLCVYLHRKVRRSWEYGVYKVAITRGGGGREREAWKKKLEKGLTVTNIFNEMESTPTSSLIILVVLQCMKSRYILCKARQRNYAVVHSPFFFGGNEGVKRGEKKVPEAMQSP